MAGDSQTSLPWNLPFLENQQFLVDTQNCLMLSLDIAAILSHLTDEHGGGNWVVEAGCGGPCGTVESREKSWFIPQASSLSHRPRTGRLLS